jgi:hypothetical protein
MQGRNYLKTGDPFFHHHGNSISFKFLAELPVIAFHPILASSHNCTTIRGVHQIGGGSICIHDCREVYFVINR